MKLVGQSGNISVVDDKRAIRTALKAFLDRKEPDSGGAALWKSRRNRAGICPKEIP